MLAVLLFLVISLFTLGNAALMVYDPKIWLETWNRFIRLTMWPGSAPWFLFDTDQFPNYLSRLSARLAGFLMGLIGLAMLLASLVGLIGRLGLITSP